MLLLLLEELADRKIANKGVYLCMIFSKYLRLCKSVLPSSLSCLSLGSKHGLNNNQVVLSLLQKLFVVNSITSEFHLKMRACELTNP